MSINNDEIVCPTSSDSQFAFSNFFLKKYLFIFPPAFDKMERDQYAITSLPQLEADRHCRITMVAHQNGLYI